MNEGRSKVLISCTRAPMINDLRLWFNRTRMKGAWFDLIWLQRRYAVLQWGVQAGADRDRWSEREERCYECEENVFLLPEGCSGHWGQRRGCCLGRLTPLPLPFSLLVSSPFFLPLSLSISFSSISLFLSHFFSHSFHSFSLSLSLFLSLISFFLSLSLSFSLALSYLSHFSLLSFSLVSL